MNRIYGLILKFCVIILILEVAPSLYGKSGSEEDCQGSDLYCLLVKANDAWMNHDFETALQALLKHLSLMEIEEPGDSIFICQDYHRLANCEKDYYKYMHDPIHLENALDYINNHFSLIHIDSTFIDISESYGDLAEIYLLFAEIRNPDVYLDSALEAAIKSLNHYPIEIFGTSDYRLFMNVIEAASKLALYSDEESNLSIVDEYIDSLLSRQKWGNEFFGTPLTDEDREFISYWNYTINEFIALTYERLVGLKQPEYYLQRAMEHIEIACDGYKASERLEGSDNCEQILKRLKAKLAQY